MVMDRQKQMAKHDIIEVGKNDGVFWMKFQDFCMNFRRLSYVRLLHCVPDWTVWETLGKWSKADKTAGGGTNSDQLGNNPQWKMEVSSGNGQPVKVVLTLKQTSPKPRKLVCAEILTLNGKTVNTKDEWRKHRAYKVDSSYFEHTWEGEIISNKVYTLWVGLWDAGDESTF